MSDLQLLLQKHLLLLQKLVEGNVFVIAATATVLLFSLVYSLGLFKASIALDKDKYVPFKLIEKEEISSDVRKFRFALQSRSHILGLPIGQHITFKYTEKVKNEEGELVERDVIRSYTPTTSNDEVGYVDFVIKVYFPLEPRFPKGGEMSQHLNNLKIGDTMLMKGPKGHLDYQGRGQFTITKPRVGKTSYKKRKIGMVAGGTGITPMLQVLRAILKDSGDRTEVWLIFANQTEDDILLRQELESISSKNFHLYYTLDRPPIDWAYGTGFINYEMCRDHLPAPGPETMLWFCGPPPMLKFACEPNFLKLGFTEDQWFAF